MNTNCPVESLLLITASTHGEALQKALRSRLNAPVLLATTLSQAAEELAGSQRRAIVLDEALCDLNPEAAEHFLARCTEEFPIFIKPAISTAERCVVQVMMGLQRMEMEKQNALRTMQKLVHSQVRDALTTILICGPLALKAPGLPPEAGKNISAMMDAAETIHRSLSDAAEQPSSTLGAPADER